MEKENKPFMLLSLRQNEEDKSKELNNYFNIVLNDLKEEGGKGGFLNITARDYSKCGKLEYLKSLFGKTFCSMECLKNELKKGGLEKTADSIEMRPIEEYRGRIIYKAKNGNGGDFAFYILK